MCEVLRRHQLPRSKTFGTKKQEPAIVALMSNGTSGDECDPANLGRVPGQVEQHFDRYPSDAPMGHANEV